MGSIALFYTSAMRLRVGCVFLECGRDEDLRQFNRA